MLKQNLQQLIAEGKIAQAMEQLLQATASDKDLHHEVLAVSARFAHYEKQVHGNTADSNWLATERNKINAALLFIIDKLYSEEKNSLRTENRIPVIMEKDNSQKTMSPAKWLFLSVALLGLLLGVLPEFISDEMKTAVQNLFGKYYTAVWLVTFLAASVGFINLSWFQTQSESNENQRNSEESDKNNKVNIEVKDQAKVGAIITGDNKDINLTQNF